MSDVCSSWIDSLLDAEHEGLFQPKQFYDSMKHILSSALLIWYVWR